MEILSDTSQQGKPARVPEVYLMKGLLASSVCVCVCVCVRVCVCVIILRLWEDYFFFLVPKHNSIFQLWSYTCLKYINKDHENCCHISAEYIVFIFKRFFDADHNGFYWICYNIASVFFLSHNSCGILPGIKPTTPALEGKILTPGPPEIYIELLKEKSNKPQNLSCETPLYVT